MFYPEIFTDKEIRVTDGLALAPSIVADIKLSQCNPTQVTLTNEARSGYVIGGVFHLTLNGFPHVIGYHGNRTF